MANGVRDSGNISMTVCNLCGTFNNLMLCKGCMGAWYCSKEHQTLHWQEHKPICRKKRLETKDSPKATPSPSKCATSRNARSVANISGGRAKQDESSVITFPDKHTATCVPEKVHVPQQDNHNTFISSFENLQEESGITRTTFIDSTDADSTVMLPTEGSVESYILECDASALNPSPTSPGNINSNMPVSSILDTKQTYLSVLESRNKSFGEYVVRCLNKFGVCVIDDFLGESKGTEIFQEVQNIQRLGLFKRGQLVNNSTTTGRPANSTKPIRGDFIHWIDGSEKYCKNIKLLVSTMDAVILHCEGQLGHYNINGRTKVGMFWSICPVNDVLYTNSNRSPV